MKQRENKTEFILSYYSDGHYNGNMVVFEKDKIPTDWKSLAGQGICIVAVTPVPFASYSNISYRIIDYQAIENSHCARRL